MPWAKRDKNPACCIFCRKEFLTLRYRYGYKWCPCHGADAEKKRLKNLSNREYHRKRQAAKGRSVTPHGPKKAIKPSEARRRREVTGVYVRPTYHLARCGHWTINRFNCPQCLDRAGNTYNLEAIIEPGYSRRMGTEGRS